MRVAEGHVCKIWLFDQETVVIPFNWEELNKLSATINFYRHNLENELTDAERKVLDNLLSNIITAKVEIEIHGKRNV